MQRYVDLTSFPAVRLDVAYSLPADVPAARLEEVVREAAGPLLAGAEIFDRYEGRQAGEGRVSIALHLASARRTAR